MGNNRSEDSLRLDSCPDSILIKVLRFLSAKQLLQIASVNRQWFRIATDDLLWKSRFLTDFNVSPPRRVLDSWRSEYRLLCYESPTIHVQTLRDHFDEVLHVAFSNDGKTMASCSKDSTIKLWSCHQHPIGLLSERNLRASLNWQYIQFCQFNADDTLLLVSGVHIAIGSNITSGEIVVYDVNYNSEKCLQFRCRVPNKPYDIFGCWFDSAHLLNGEHMLINQSSALGISASHLWLCRAAQDCHNERSAVLAPFLKFLNRNGANLRMIMVGKYVSDTLRNVTKLADKANRHNTTISELMKVEDSPSSSQKLVDRVALASIDCNNCKNHSSSADCYCICHNCNADRLVIFTTGTRTYTPHQVGFKMVSSQEMLQRLNAEVMPQERREAILEKVNEIRHRRESGWNDDYDDEEMSGGDSDSITDDDDGQNNKAWHRLQKMFDQPDHLIDMHGHIIGMALSPDHRELYVNIRPWPADCNARQPFPPPDLEDRIEMRVIDLEAMLIRSDRIFLGHRGYTRNEDCFFIFLDVAKHIVCSGSEDYRGYLWSRDYGCKLAEFEHSDVVNSVAINPIDPEMLATASDDHTIKIWRSKRRIDQMMIK